MNIHAMDRDERAALIHAEMDLLEAELLAVASANGWTVSLDGKSAVSESRYYDVTAKEASAPDCDGDRWDVRIRVRLAAHDARHGSHDVGVLIPSARHSYSRGMDVVVETMAEAISDAN